jgi:ureidoglycolate lyase
MTRIVEVPVERLTVTAFKPFGQILGLIDSPPAYSGGGLQSWRLDFDVEGRTDLMLTRYACGPLEFDVIERHFDVTQVFVPLGNAPSIMVAAAPTERARIPDPEDIHAFYVPGSMGIMLWKGTWHAATRFPLRQPGADFALLTGTDTQRELERQQVDGIQPKLTQVVNLADNFDVHCKITDPDALVKS